MRRDSCSQQKNERIAKQEDRAKQEQRTHLQEKEFIGQLPDDSSQIMRPQRLRHQTACAQSRDQQGRDVERPVGVPRFRLTREHGGQQPHKSARDGGDEECKGGSRLHGELTQNEPVGPRRRDRKPVGDALGLLPQLLRIKTKQLKAVFTGFFGR